MSKPLLNDPARRALTWAMLLAVIPAAFVAVLAAAISPGFRTAHMGPIALGVIAYVWMLEAVYLACRPHWLDRLIGLPYLYVMHGVLGTLALVLAALHRMALPAYSLVRLTGGVSYTLLFLGVLLALVFMARPIAELVPPIARLRARLARVLSHETSVWLHRILLLAVVFAWAHFHLIFYIVRARPFIIMADATTLFVLASYVLDRIGRHTKAWHGVVAGCRTVAPGVAELAVRVRPSSPSVTGMTWEEGDFTFIRFPKVWGMKEYHPFSIINTPDDTAGKNVMVRFAIRTDGDFTRRLPQVAQAGERVDLLPPFGRYRRFLDEHDGDRPIVMYAGGIGITPLLPLAFSYGGRRRIVLMYSASDADGLLYRDGLEAWRRRTGNTLILKTGRFSPDELNRAVMPEAVYLIAGPASMNRAVRRMLRGSGVRMADICYEPFAF
ncbi:ferric reductase [Bifidobacterium primatium]|uniref:Ferric reductase n=1 Tax=Bifidobacterium primatium TaxID=2045438 RepID=A0A2M9H7X3_9BIFI|nr:FAD-dependent oxidoreductase [Bifidobacterium primatium]PJM72908.1 ferric reductase [Bifidobacterium primatium]